MGNKCDLAADRVISRSQGEALAAKWGISFVETSALKDVSVKDAFMQLPRKIMRDRAQRQVTAKRAKSRCTIC